MEIRIISAFILINSIRLCYQQDTTVCNIGYDYINGACVPQSCPNNYVLVNGVCRLKDISPPQIPTTNAPSVYCHNGYILYNGMCYHNTVTVPSPCQPRACGIFNCPSACIPVIPVTTTTTVAPTTTKTTTTTTTTTPLPPLPPPVETRGCPPDSILVGGKCRLIYCTKGSIYKGRCLEPVCSDGLVWTGYTCAQPEVITTILEIENTFITEVNRTGPVYGQPKITNNVVYHTEAYETSTEEKPCDTTTPTTEAPSASTKCCTVVTPRICKKYNQKWVCFNRQYRRCDEVCGNFSIVYLRIAKVIDQPPLLLMPPNPPLKVCAGDECKPKDVVDCSGCAKNERASCSSYCYRYRCPENRCTFIDQSQYCTKHPGGPGCQRSDGCVEEWCSE